MANPRDFAPKAAAALALSCALTFALVGAPVAQSTNGPVSSDDIQSALSGSDKIDDINAIIQLEIPTQPVASSASNTGIPGVNAALGEGFVSGTSGTPGSAQATRKPAQPAPPKLILVDSSRSIDLPVNFAYDSADLSPEATAQLNALAQVLTQPEFANDRFLIAGHTDAAGSAEYNLALSNRRAQSVLAYLIEAFDVSKGRFVVAGFGETRLADPENSRDAINRRVEIAVLAD